MFGWLWAGKVCVVASDYLEIADGIEVGVMEVAKMAC